MDGRSIRDGSRDNPRILRERSPCSSLRLRLKSQVIHVPSLLQPESGRLHRHTEAEDEIICAEILKMPSPVIKRSCVPERGGAGSGAMKRTAEGSRRPISLQSSFFFHGAVRDLVRGIFLWRPALGDVPRLSGLSAILSNPPRDGATPSRPRPIQAFHK
jgi:hypothetical protein